MTTYDEIWESFLQNCKVDDVDLPNTFDKICASIHNAISHYNNRMMDNLEWDDAQETVSRKLNYNELILLAHYLRAIFLQNQLTYFSMLWQPFSNDLGLRNFSSQLKTLGALVENEYKVIEGLIANQEEDYI